MKLVVMFHRKKI